MSALPVNQILSVSKQKSFEQSLSKEPTVELDQRSKQTIETKTKTELLNNEESIEEIDRKTTFV